MKKLTILLALVLLAVTLPVFALDVTTTGRFTWFGNWEFSPLDSSGDISYGRIGWDVKVDDFNTVKVRLRAENVADDWFDANNETAFRLKNFMLVSDLTGALGLKLPVSVKATVGLFDTYFTGWWYASMSGWESYYALPGLAGAQWDGMLVQNDRVQQGAVQFDVGIMEKATLHAYTDLTGQYVMVGADAAVGPAAIWLAYGASGNNFGKGDISVEAKVDVPELLDGLKIMVPGHFRYGLGSKDYSWMGGLAVDYSMFHVGAGIQGDNGDAIHHIVADLSVVPVEAAKIWVSFYMDQAGTNAFSAVDIAASYKFGATNLIIGYLIGGEDKLAIPIYGDNAAYANGLYFGFDCSF